MSMRITCGASTIANTVPAIANAPNSEARPLARPAEAATMVSATRIEAMRARPRLSTIRSVCIAAFHANAVSGRPIGASVQPVERTL